MKKTKKELEAEKRFMAELLDAIQSDKGSKGIRFANVKTEVMNDGQREDLMFDFWQGMSRQLVSIADAAEMRDATTGAIYQLIKRGRLNAIEFGGKQYLIRKQVEDFERAKPGRKPEK